MGISSYSEGGSVQASSRHPIHLQGISRGSAKISPPGSRSRQPPQGLRNSSGASPRDSLPHPAQDRPRLPRHPIPRSGWRSQKRPRRRLQTSRAIGAGMRTQCAQMRIGALQRSFPSHVISNAGRKQDTPNPRRTELLHEPEGPEQEHQPGMNAMLARPIADRRAHV